MLYGAVEHWLSGALVNVGDMIYDHKIGLPCTKAPMSRVEFRDSIPAYITCTQTVPYEICNTCTFTKLSETVVVYASVRKPGFAYRFSYMYFREGQWLKQGAHLTKPGWSKPHTHSNPTNLALFRHKITLYRFNQGAHTFAGGSNWSRGLSPRAPSL